MSSRPFNDAEAADPLLCAYFEKRANLIRYFAARTGSTAQAEDLAQDLYLKLASRQESGDARAPVALLYRIATNLMLDTIRGARRSEQREIGWRTESSAFLGGEEIVQDAPADEQMVHQERLRELAQAVMDLPPKMQEAFRLHKLQGRSQADTARAMGVSVKAVEKHIRNALLNLSRRLQS